MMKRQMEKIDIPPIPEFIELVADSGVRLYACKATVDMFGLTMEDFVPQVEDIISSRRVLREGGRRPDHLHLGARMARYRIRDEQSAISIDLTEFGGRQDEFLMRSPSRLPVDSVAVSYLENR